MNIKIYIPTHESEEALLTTLPSVLQQGLNPKNIIIVDNCSTDRTPQLAHSFGVTLIQNPINLGRVGNWNKCLDLFRESDAEAMKFVFAGDELTNESIKVQNECLKFADFITGSHLVNDGENRYMMRHFKKDLYLSSLESLNTAKEKEKGNWIAGCTACPMFTKKALGDSRFDESLLWASDFKFWTELSSKNYIYYRDKITCVFNMQFRKGYNTQVGTQNSIAEEHKVFDYLNKLKCNLR